MSTLHPSTLFGCLNAVAAEKPDAEAVVFQDERLTYGALVGEVEQVARALLAAGVKPGDRVAMLATCRLEFWLVFLATTAIGGIWLGLGTRNQLDELRYVVNDAEPALLIGISDFEGRDYRDDLRTLAAETASVREVVCIGASGPGAIAWAAFLQRGESVPASEVASAAATVQPLDPAFIVYTSGTTGRPKGAVLSHYGLVEGNRVQSRRYPADTLPLTGICSFPINHVACAGDTCCALMVGGGTIILTERFDPREQLRIVERERCSVWGGIPTMVQMTLNLPDFDQFDLSSVKAMGWGGAAMPREIIERLRLLCPSLGLVYGLTETTVNVTWTQPQTDIDVLAGSIGRPPPEFPCRIADDAGAICGEGEAGEIQFKGDFNMLGYWRRPEATAAAFTDDGWLRTGDLGFWRADGNISLVGRRSEMFKSGGFNVYPREVELAIEEHPEVEYAAVVSQQDPLYAEVGRAYVMLQRGSNLTARELDTFIRSKIANYKVPKVFEIVPELPTLANGKIDKVQLKARAAAA
ncbi:MAG: long-chain fatty acid--CoA ligase [Phenylobacterium sp.]|uniref:class I adenylate-forming enzyme family protein n=1 Tax=Phenylobacterium sp. TaxID=1871053 RepID=UPI001227D559|nr:class I adenylate-forming enzyme family protein [Phenylobacterium sp.]TAJ68864.1 MAG: long-chain fatty acid--CoA ligase [Phenylobacterium sp.]